MLCRALFAAVVVSYVLCVLLLSGVQKEDLDEGTLRKLQRHNVNIADIDDRKLREQCFVENETSTLAPKQVDSKEEENKTTAKPTSDEFDGDVRASQAQFKKLFEYFKKHEDKKEAHVKETTTTPVLQSGNILDFNTLPSSVKYRVIKDIADSVTELSQNTTNKKDNEKTKTADDDKDKEKPLQISDKIHQEFKTPSIQNEKPIIENSNNVGYISKIVSQILKQKTANDDKDKEKPLQISDKTQQEFKTPSITNEKPINENSNNVGYISKIVSQILNQKQLNQVQPSTVPFELNAKKLIHDKDSTAAENSLSRSFPSNYYLNTFNVTGKLKNIAADERAKNKEENEIIASILNQLRDQNRLPTAYIKESLSEYDQYLTERWKTKQLKTNLNEDQKGALDFVNTLTPDILSRRRNVPDNNQQIKNKWPLDIDSGSAKAFGAYLEEQRSPPINQIIERGKTINEKYPSVNEEYKIKWPYYIDNLSKKQEPISEMEQGTAINAFNGRYHPINNNNNRNDDEEYKRTRSYFLANQNNKHASNLEDKDKISLFDRTNDYERVTNTNIPKYPFVESQRKSKWSYDGQNDDELGFKFNKQQNSASIDGPYSRRDTTNNKNDRSAQPIDYDDQRIGPNLGIGQKNTLLSRSNELKKYFMGSQSSKRQPINIQEQREEPQYFTNNKVPNQNTYQYELLPKNYKDGNFLANTETMTERSQKHIANKLSNNENKTEDNSKIEIITPDVIKKIADTVKTIVLKDLKSEQSTTKPTTMLTTTKTTTTTLLKTTATPKTTTQTTTETTTPTTSKTTTPTTTITTTQRSTTPTTTKATCVTITTANEISSTAAKEDHVKIQEASKALEQFMKVFEQFKTMKNEIESPYNVVQPKSVNVVNNDKPVNNMNTLPYPPPMVNYYDTRNSKSKSKAIILDPYTDKVTPNPIIIQNKAPSNHIFAPPPGQALTIQTNYDIIPPLNVPLSNPLVQTLIITTKSPFIIEQNVPHQSNTFISHRKPDRYQAQKHELYSSNPSKHRNYREPFHFKFDKKTKPRNVKKEHSYSKPYMSRTYRDDEKFHEKLERDDRTRLMSRERKCFGSEETCNEKVAKRNQRPLAHVPSTYDDSHFRNFLKTQQKVNDMLERILATKTKYENRPPSAEII